MPHVWIHKVYIHQTKKMTSLPLQETVIPTLNWWVLELLVDLIMLNPYYSSHWNSLAYAHSIMLFSKVPAVCFLQLSMSVSLLILISVFPSQIIKFGDKPRKEWSKLWSKFLGFHCMLISPTFGTRAAYEGDDLWHPDLHFSISCWANIKHQLSRCIQLSPMLNRWRCKTEDQ
jgi:hypothetical protein